MQTEEILSAGIDIGTSTTQLVFSRMILQNTGGFGRIPQIKVVSKEVIYESEIYFTPLSSREEIDGERVHEIIKKEYEKAGVCPGRSCNRSRHHHGETSRKRNAESVVRRSPMWRESSSWRQRERIWSLFWQEKVREPRICPKRRGSG